MARWAGKLKQIASNMKTRKGCDMAGRAVKPKDVLSLLHRQNFRCAYSGQPLTPENAAADHRDSISRGGSHGIENVAITTRQVNAAKGTMTVDEFVEMCRQVVAHMGGSSVPASEGENHPSPESLAGKVDPVEILTILGYVEAAEMVRQMEGRVREEARLRELRKGKGLTYEQATDERRTEIAKLNQEIQSLRSVRSQLRAQTGYVTTKAN